MIHKTTATKIASKSECHFFLAGAVNHVTALAQENLLGGKGFPDMPKARRATQQLHAIIWVNYSITK